MCWRRQERNPVTLNVKLDYKVNPQFKKVKMPKKKKKSVSEPVVVRSCPSSCNKATRVTRLQGDLEVMEGMPRTRTFGWEGS